MASPLSVKVDVLQKDFGFEYIKAEIAKLKKKPFVKVGVQGKSALGQKETKDGEPSKATVVDVATAHEFGTDKVPERSFIRKTVISNQQKYAALKTELAGRILDPVAKFTTEKALAILGEAVVSDIRNTIRTNNAGLNGPTPLSAERNFARNSKVYAKAQATLDRLRGREQGGYSNGVLVPGRPLTNKQSAARTAANEVLIRGADAVPLYDTGQLIRSNTYKVEMNGGAKGGDIMDEAKS